MNEKLIRKLGLLGIVSFLSYAAAVIFSPLSYPGYNWVAQAVSDLSADSAPSRVLWNQLGALYMPCGIVCVTMAVVLLSIASLLCIVFGGLVQKECPSLGKWALTALALMMIGAVGTAVLPQDYFGIPERFSVFAASGFTAVLGIYLNMGWRGIGETIA